MPLIADVCRIKHKPSMGANPDHIWIIWATVFAGLLVIATIVMISLQIKFAKRDMFIKNLLLFEEKFDSEKMIGYRKKLAEQLINGAPHADIKEPVLNFFESLGLAVKMKALRKEMVWSDFSFYSIRWFLAVQEYIREEQRINNDDTTIFGDFRYLVDEMQKIEIKKQREEKRKNQKNLSLKYFELTQKDIDDFLKNEKDEAL